MRVFFYFIFLLLCFRIQKATESLRTFHPAADPCFDEFVLDTSREEMLLKEMCFGGGKWFQSKGNTWVGRNVIYWIISDLNPVSVDFDALKGESV